MDPTFFVGRLEVSSPPWAPSRPTGYHEPDEMELEYTRSSNSSLTLPVIAESDELRELMVGYQQGRIEDFDKFYRKMAPSVRSYLGWKCLDPNGADDLVQEVFLQIHRSRHTYQACRPVKPWVFAIARHVCLMSLRTKRTKTPTDQGLASLLEQLPIPADAERLAESAVVSRAILELSPRRRESFLLHHLWGFTFPEVGKILGISATAAKVRCHRASQDLRAALTQGGGSRRS